jgi:hypothetical protein
VQPAPAHRRAPRRRAPPRGKNPSSPCTSTETRPANAANGTARQFSLTATRTTPVPHFPAFDHTPPRPDRLLDSRPLRDVSAVDLVIERVEPSSGVGLGRPVERSLQFSDFVLLGSPSHLWHSPALPYA